MININLLPPELKLKRIAAKRNASLVTICFVIVLIFAIIGIIGQSFQSTIESYLTNTKGAVDQSATEIDQYQDLQDMALLINDRWQTTEDLDKNRVYWSQVLLALGNCAPVDVQFESLTMNSTKTPNFTLQGNTISDKEVVKFKDKLDSSPFFKNVTFKSSSLTGQTAGETTPENQKLKFTLEFDLEQTKVE